MFPISEKKFTQAKSVAEKNYKLAAIIHAGEKKLMAEVIKILGDVYVQVFESTRGLKVGAPAEFTGHMLEVQLGPGMLSKNYDGLQNDLDKMEGVFLKRGQYTEPLDNERLWISLKRTDRKILTILARKGNPLTERSLPSSTAFSAVKRLVKQGYVIKTNNYELEDPFFGEWILRGL